MLIQFDGDVFTSNREGANLLAEQATKARSTVQIATLDGSNTTWPRQTSPCLLLVNRRQTVRYIGENLDAFIEACRHDGDIHVGATSPR